VEALWGRNSTTILLESHLSGDGVVDCGYFFLLHIDGGVETLGSGGQRASVA
jgi:hypothetical protein